MDALERVCTRPQEERINQEIKMKAVDVAIKIYQTYVKSLDSSAIYFLCRVFPILFHEV